MEFDDLSNRVMGYANQEPCGLATGFLIVTKLKSGIKRFVL